MKQRVKGLSADALQSTYHHPLRGLMTKLTIEMHLTSASRASYSRKTTPGKVLYTKQEDSLYEVLYTKSNLYEERVYTKRVYEERLTVG